MKRAAISLIFLMFSAAYGQDSPDARAILDKVTQAAKAGRTYRAEFSGSEESKGKKSTFAGYVIFQPPGKVHTELEVGKAETVMIGDGEQTWIYLAAMKRYVKVRTSSGADPRSPNPSMLWGGSVNGLVSAQSNPDEEVVLDGSPVHCYVITADFENRQGPGGLTHFTMWIDQTNSVILRFQASSLQTTQDMTVNKLIWEPVLTGKEFVFTPPEGATELVLPVPAASAVSGTIRAATLIKRVSPEYPEDAKAARIQGTVRLTALLGKDGTVKNLELVSGHPMLVQAAMDAVKQWVYQPTLVNGQSVEVRTPIEVNFRLETTESPTGVYRIGGGVSEPRVASKQEPQYSEEARIGRLQGTVTVSLVVGEDGTPRNIRVLKPVGLGLDEQALQAVEQWRFTPGEKDGKPVPVIATIEVNFRLMDSGRHWHLTRAAFKPPEEVSLPTLIKTTFPGDSASADAGAVVLTLDVDEQGLPVNIHVEKSSDAQSEEDVIMAVREWRFNPGLKDGAEVVVPVTLEFSFARKEP
jgi:TonB family protein